MVIFVFRFQAVCLVVIYAFYIVCSMQLVVSCIDMIKDMPFLTLIIHMC